jgi:hypothetical protein
LFAGSSSLGCDTIVDTQDTDPDHSGNILDFTQLAPDATSNAGIALDLGDTTSQSVSTNLSLTLSSDDFEFRSKKVDRKR